jgi:hypothetical protein
VSNTEARKRLYELQADVSGLIAVHAESIDEGDRGRGLALMQQTIERLVDVALQDIEKLA